MRKVIAKINLKNIRDNALAWKAHTKKKLCAVVKADAYGHGAEEVVSVLDGVADAFAVALVEEAISLRVAACGTDILILTPPVCLNDAVCAVQNSFIFTVSSLSEAKMAYQAAKLCKKTARVHLKVNTGMNRYGMSISELGKVCAFLHSKKQVAVEGLYSHLHDTTRKSAEAQRERFLRMRAVCVRYFPSVICHLSATYGTLLGEEFFFDMTRVGIGVYGYLPDGAKDMDQEVVRALHLKKAMRVYAAVVESREYSYGGVGYGKALSKRARGQVKRLNVLRVGYADGFLRKKRNGLNGNEKQINRLCMDACLRIGRKRKGTSVCIMSDAAKTAKACKTISYEVLCAATKRAERVYTYGVAVCRRRRNQRSRA